MPAPDSMSLLKQVLDEFEKIIDKAHLDHVRETARKVFEFEPVEQLPFIYHDPVPKDGWPAKDRMGTYNETTEDPALMLVGQLYYPYLHHRLKDHHALSIRANYGTVILPSVFGVPWQLTETSMPWSHSLEDRNKVRNLIDAGVPDLFTDLGGKCLETAEFYREQLAPYPKLNSHVEIYHPDLQGPYDVAHLIWGKDIFLGMFDVPELVHSLLKLVTETYIAYMTEWRKRVPAKHDIAVHWQYFMPDGVMLRDDTPVMLSPQQYEEFVRPYDQQVLDTFGGGIHFCGCGAVFVDSMFASGSLCGINISQPELNDMAHVLDLARKNKVVMMGLDESIIPDDWNTGAIIFKKRPTLR